MHTSVRDKRENQNGEYEDQESGTTIAGKCHGFNGMALRAYQSYLRRYQRHHRQLSRAEGGDRNILAHTSA